MRARAVRSAMMFAASIAAAACTSGSYDATVPTAYCSATIPIAILVRVRDSVTLAAKADSAGGTVQAGAYVDTLRLDSPGSAFLRGGNQLGTYAVSVQRPGYHPWTRAGVQVTQTGTCGGPVAVTIDALLQPLP